MKTFKESFLAKLEEDTPLAKDQLTVKKGISFEPDEQYNADDVHSILNKAADDEEIETVAFGLETDENTIVKVYVNVEDADRFEEMLGQAFGEQDNIEELLDELSRDHDIVDVVWPDEEDGEEDDEFGDEEAPEEDENALETDGSESLNDKAFKESLGQRFKSKVLSEAPDLEQSLSDMNPDEAALERYSKNKHVALAIEAMKAIGIPPAALEFVFKRQPALAREIRDNMLAIGSMNRKRLAQAFNMDPATMSMDDEENMDDHDIPSKDDQEHMHMHMDGEPCDCADEVKEHDEEEKCNCGGSCEECIAKYKENFDKDEVHEGAVTTSLEGIVIESGDFKLELNTDESLDFSLMVESRKTARFNENRTTFTPKGDTYVVFNSINGKSSQFVLEAEDVAKIADF